MPNAFQNASPDTDQENVSPSANQENISPSAILANVRDTARIAIGNQIDGTAKNIRKGSRRERFSDAEKVERVYSLADGITASLDLVDDVVLYLSSAPNSGNSLAIEALKLASSAGKKQLGQVRCTIENTRSKPMAATAHSKLTKADKLRALNQQLQRRSLAPTNPRKMLQLAISNTKLKLETAMRNEGAVSSASDCTEITAPRPKRSKLTTNELDMCFTNEERRRIIYSSIRFPRPQGGNLVYSAAEAVNVVRTLVNQNATSPEPFSERTFLTLVKEKMIKERRTGGIVTFYIKGAAQNCQH